jgi:hypothetical protein
MTAFSDQQFSRSACPVEQLEWFANRSLPIEEQQMVEAHLVHCAVCREEVAALRELRLSLRGASAHTPEPRADLFPLIEQRLEHLARPARWSRLRVDLQRCWSGLGVCLEHLFAQARLIRRDLFWMPLLLVPLVASVIFLPAIWQNTPAPAALLAALLTALGMAFLYGPRVDPAREIVLVTRTSPRLVLAVRCVLVFGYDLLLNCGLVMPLLVSQGIVTPAWFLANWLAPLCCLSALALLLSILANASTAVLVCTLLWGVRLLNSVQSFVLGSARSLPEAPWQRVYEQFWHQGPLLFGVALLAFILAFVVLERKERFTR